MSINSVLHRYELLPKDEVPEGVRKPKQQLQPFNNKLKIYFLIALIFSTCLLALYLNIFPWTGQTHDSNFLDEISISLGLKKCIYSVVIDAGSTGSRVLTYAFIEAFGERTLKLYKEYFLEVKPGLSAFVKNPEESTKGLELLIKEAKSRIPQESWSNTAIVLKATAGLRLLPEDRASAVLNNARNVLRTSGFYYTENSVSILDGTDEGLMSWFTVNFLLDRLGGDSSRTVAALDLGGGSTQVSYSIDANVHLSHSNEKYLQKITAFHQDMKLYSHSHLGFGLNEARKNILQHGSKNHSNVFKSECINPLVNTQWKYAGVSYTVQGPEIPHYIKSEERGEVYKTPIVEFQDCESIVKQFISSLAKPPGLGDKEIYAFSYYYDRAAESGLIDFKTGGFVSVREIINTAKAKCREANIDQPFMCLDLVYIGVLLKDGFGLNPSTKIHLVKWIDGHEVSWALGAAFHTLQNGI